MITLNGKYFSEYGDTSSATGFAVRYKRHIKLFDINHDLIGVITKYGVVAKASKRSNGYWYSYADIDILGDYSLQQQRADINNIAIKSQLVDDFERAYWFK